MSRMVIYFCCISVLVQFAFGQGVITTVAGGGTDPGDGGPATSAALYSPYHIAVDSAGNLYISDSGPYVIRKVNTAGIITTVAGNGSIGGTPVNGVPAVSAGLDQPTGVAVDSLGNLYIAETDDVRKVDTGGIITTVAGNDNEAFSGDGGPAINAALDFPVGVAVDGAGNLYIADGGNARIRKVNTAGIITTVAGNGSTDFSGDGGPATSAGLLNPRGVAVDRAGNIYIADFGHSRIRKVNTAGIITTVAGNGSFGFSGNGGPATSAALFGPSGVAVDSAGDLYIADSNNNCIRKVDTAGTITTVAGTPGPTGGDSGDGGLATSAELNRPQDVGLDSAGDLYIAGEDGRIRKVTGVAPPSTPVSIVPVISANGVVNGASFQPGIAPGSWATIEGSNFTSVTDNWNNSIVNGKLPSILDGVTVTIGGQPAALYYISPSQLNLLVPNVGPGPVQVIVTNSAGTSAAFTVTSSQYGPAFFPWPNNQVVATRQDFSLAAKSGTFAGVVTVPSKPGDVIILWGTGFGPTTPAAPAGVQVPSDQTYSTATLPTVTIDNIPAMVFGAALAPGYAGLYQVAIQVPASLGNGDWPIVANVAGVQSPNGMVLSVQQ